MSTYGSPNMTVEEKARYNAYHRKYQAELRRRERAKKLRFLSIIIWNKAAEDMPDIFKVRKS